MSGCPFCEEPIWGEGWDPKTGKRFFSHVSPTQNMCCAYELALATDGSWSRMLLCNSAAPPDAIATGKDSKLYMQGFEDGKVLGYRIAHRTIEADRKVLAAHWKQD